MWQDHQCHSVYWLCVAAGNARKNREGVVSRSVVYFTHHVPQLSINSPEPLKLRKILDMVSFCVGWYRWWWSDCDLSECCNWAVFISTLLLEMGIEPNTPNSNPILRPFRTERTQRVWQPNSNRTITMTEPNRTRTFVVRFDSHVRWRSWFAVRLQNSNCF